MRESLMPFWTFHPLKELVLQIDSYKNVRAD